MRCFRYFLLISLTACSGVNLYGCSGALKTNSDSSTKSSGKTETTTEQPEDVAGGFGLSCLPSYTAVTNITDVDYSCSLNDSDDGTAPDGQNTNLELVVKVGENVIPIDSRILASKKTFGFRIPLADKTKVQITSKNQVTTLERFATKWDDMTLLASRGQNNCQTLPDSCAKRDPKSNLWWSKPQSNAQTWNEATNTCSALSYNAVTGWRLPTIDELLFASRDDIQFNASDSWLTSDMMNREYWSSDVSDSTTGWYGILSSGYRWVDAKTQKKSVVCVREDQIIWQNMTGLDSARKASCKSTPGKCILKLVATNTLYGGILTGSATTTWKTWDEAQALCQTYNPTDPNSSQNAGWTLPSLQQLREARVNGIKDIEGWRGDAITGDAITGEAMIGEAFWTNESAESNMAQNFNFLDGNSGTSLMTKQLQVICVKNLN